jgi:hypothetical protein
VRGAVAALNPTCVASDTNVVATAVKSLEAAMSNLRAQLQYTSSRAYADEAARDAATARIEGRIGDTQKRIDNLESRLRSADVCPICYETEFVNRTVSPCCSNSFCFACITTWLVGGARGGGGREQRRGECPMCKAHIDPTKLIVVCEGENGAGADGSAEGTSAEAAGADGAAEGTSADGAAGTAEGTSAAGAAAGSRGLAPFPGADGSRSKIENLRALVRHFLCEAARSGAPRRVLVFSDNDEVMGRVSGEVMRAEGVPHSFLKSNAAVINARAREFRDTAGVYALLTNIKYYGSGLDLSAATDIVLMHKVQDGMAAQVVGRAQRPPRTEPLRIWKFRNDIEEPY